MKSERHSGLITLDIYNNNKYKDVFYYTKDIKKSLEICGYKNVNLKKKDLLDKLFSFYENINSYNKHIDVIRFIQNKFRKINLKKKIEHHGIGIVDKEKCSNKEDFYTFENIDDIDEKYFFSYEKNGFIYFFDIRSFDQLVKNDCLNPYNREKIPDKAILAFNKRKKYLIKHYPKNNDFNVEIDKNLTKSQQLKNKVVEIFQKIDMLDVSAGGSNINWFLDLSSVQLKMLYKSLEDIWNFRADLTLEKKKEIVPLNDVFKKPVYDIIRINNTNKIKLQTILLNEMDKLVSSSPSDIHKSTGAYYILIALVEVSPVCAECMPWLIQPS